MRQLFISLLICLFVHPATLQASDELVIGIFPRHNYTETFAMFNPMVKYLASKTGYKVRLETARDFAGFWENVANKRYDIVHFNQYQYLISHRDYQYQIILKNEEFGESTIASVIMVRQDSGINSLKDLQGKTVIFGGDKTAMMSYLLPRHMLQQAGLTDGSYHPEFARNPPNALMAVSIGRADACGIGDAIPKLRNIAQRINIDELRVLAKSEAFPHLAWAVKKEMRADIRTSIQSALMTLNGSEEGKKILERAKLTGLHKAEHSEYQPLMKYIEDEAKK